MCVIGTPRSRISFASTMLLNPSAPFGCPCAEAKSLQSQQRRLTCTFPRLRQTGGQHRLRDGAAKGQCPVMGWSGRAPAPPASEAGKGRQRQGARHVSDTQYRDCRDRHRYRQELVPRRGPRCARRHRAAAKVVAWPSGSAARQYIALPDRHGSLRRRTSPEPQTRIAWSRCQVDAGQICPPL